jgi:hypothetical protein
MWLGVGPLVFSFQFLPNTRADNREGVGNKWRSPHISSKAEWRRPHLRKKYFTPNLLPGRLFRAQGHKSTCRSFEVFRGWRTIKASRVEEALRASGHGGRLGVSDDVTTFGV